MPKTVEEKRAARREYMRDYRQKRKQELEVSQRRQNEKNDIKYAEFQARYWAERVQELKAASKEEGESCN